MGTPSHDADAARQSKEWPGFLRKARAGGKVELDLWKQAEKRAMSVRDPAGLSGVWRCALVGLHYFRGGLGQVFVNFIVCVIITKELPPIERARSP